MINGQKYEIGALYIGGGAFDRLHQTFGVKCHTIPIRCGVRVGEHIVSFPIDWKTLWELKACGVPGLEIIRFLYRCRILSDPSTFQKYESVGHLIDELTTDASVRQFLHALFGGTGVSSYGLSPQYLCKENPMIHYKLSEPEFLPEGNGKISSILFDLAQKNGKAVFNARVNKILVENGCAVGVETDQGEFSGQVVVSNAGLQATILRLTDSEIWQAGYYRQVKSLKESLKAVYVFLTFSRSIVMPPGFAVFAECDDLDKELRILEKGHFSNQSNYALHVPSNIEPNSRGDHRASLVFYYPRRRVTSQCLEDRVHRIMYDGLEKLFKGFSRAITSYAIYDPIRYEREFGFPPYVFGVSPAQDQRRFPVRTPIPNLFCVGDSVQPDGPSVPQAMESGIAAARIVAQYLRGVPVTSE